MKILIIFPHAGGRGGVETVLKNILNTPISKKYKITLMLEDIGDLEWIKDLPRYIDIIKNPFHNKFLMALYHVQQLLRSNYDIIIELGIKGLNLDNWVKKIKKYKIISWYHLSLDEGSYNLKSIRCADHYWAISSDIKLQLLERGIPSEKISLIYNPVSYQKKIDSSNFDKVHFVYLGRVENKQKNLQELFEGLSRLRNDNTNKYILHIYGTGDDQTYLEKKAQQLHINVVWHGWLENPWEEIKKNGINYLILTSNYEGFGMVLAEAISRGIPVISSDCVAGPRDIVRNSNGYLYHLHDINELAELLNKVIEERKKWDGYSVQKSIDFLYIDKYLHKINDSLNKLY